MFGTGVKTISSGLTIFPDHKTQKIMKTIILSAFMAFAVIANAQTERVEKAATEDQQKERMMKTLDLNEKETEKAYPIITQYRSEQKMYRQKQMKLMRSSEVRSEKMSEKDIERQQRMKFEARRDKLEMDQKYYDQLLEVVPASKVEKMMEEKQERTKDRVRRVKNMRENDRSDEMRSKPVKQKRERR
jgi:hypothetical protein